MGTSLINTGVQFPDATVQTSAAVSSSYTGGIGQVFTSSGTFTVPAGVTAVKVTVTGGGGGAGGYYAGHPYGARSGYGGGQAIAWVSGLTSGSNVSVTVGAGGSGGSAGYPPTNGVSGGTSSFGSYCSATGGGGGYASSNNSTPTPLPTPGNGVNGFINYASSSSSAAGQVSQISSNYPKYGNGGLVGAPGAAGSPGTAGFVIVEY